MRWTPCAAVERILRDPQLPIATGSQGRRPWATLLLTTLSLTALPRAAAHSVGRWRLPQRCSRIGSIMS